jgi:hypothetical protein
VDRYPGGTSEFPIFYPKVVVIDRAGNRLMVTGEVKQLDPGWTWTTTARIRGQWRATLPETGPYYVLVTSQHGGPDYVGELGASCIGQVQLSSAVGQIRLSVEHVG